MKYLHPRVLCAFIGIWLLTWADAGYGVPRVNPVLEEPGWHELEPGLELGVFPVADAPDAAAVHVLRIDPAYFEFRLLNASATTPQELRSAREWCEEYNLVAAINASMYQQDYLSSVSLMRTAGHINNPRLSKDRAVLTFDRRTTTVPALRIIDRQCENFDDWTSHYSTFVQSIRMISCTGQNVWRQNAQKWSTAAIAVDYEGRGLFIHVRAPFSTHDLINILLELPLGISRAMYAEGGREAQLYLHSGEQKYEFVGSYGPGFMEGSRNRVATRIPNVIGISRRKR